MGIVFQPDPATGRPARVYTPERRVTLAPDAASACAPGCGCGGGKAPPGGLCCAPGTFQYLRVEEDGQGGFRLAHDLDFTFSGVTRRVKPPGGISSWSWQAAVQASGTIPRTAFAFSPCAPDATLGAVANASAVAYGTASFSGTETINGATWSWGLAGGGTSRALTLDGASVRTTLALPGTGEGELSLALAARVGSTLAASVTMGFGWRWRNGPDGPSVLIFANPRFVVAGVRLNPPPNLQGGVTLVGPKQSQFDCSAPLYGAVYTEQASGSPLVGEGSFTAQREGGEGFAGEVIDSECSMTAALSPAPAPCPEAPPLPPVINPSECGRPPDGPVEPPEPPDPPTDPPEEPPGENCCPTPSGLYVPTQALVNLNLSVSLERYAAIGENVGALIDRWVVFVPNTTIPRTTPLCDALIAALIRTTIPATECWVERIEGAPVNGPIIRNRHMGFEAALGDERSGGNLPAGARLLLNVWDAFTQSGPIVIQIGIGAAGVTIGGSIGGSFGPSGANVLGPPLIQTRRAQGANGSFVDWINLRWADMQDLVKVGSVWYRARVGMEGLLVNAGPCPASGALAAPGAPGAPGVPGGPLDPAVAAALRRQLGGCAGCGDPGAGGAA